MAETSAFLLYRIIFGTFLSVLVKTSAKKDPETISVVLNSGSKNDQDFIQILEPPSALQNNLHINVEYMCSTERLIGVEVITDLESKPGLKVFQKVWRCSSRTDNSKKKTVKLKLPDYLAYNVNVFNEVVKCAKKTKLRAWVLETVWWKSSRRAHNSYNRALAKVAYDSTIPDPFSREFKNYGCVSWSYDVLNQVSSMFIPQCRVEPEILQVVDYPAALSGIPLGIYRKFPKYRDENLEAERVSIFTKPKFTVVMWLYILEYCPDPGVLLCSIYHHFSWKGEYLSPLLFIRKDGLVHVQFNEANGGSSAGLSAFALPRHQWIRLVFLYEKRTWRLTVNYGENFKEILDTHFIIPEAAFLDDADGLFAFGGAEFTPSFRGYIGQVTYYRRKCLSPDKIPFPSPFHPMFELGLARREEKCHFYLNWVKYRVYVSKQQRMKYIQKSSCPVPFYALVFRQKYSRPSKTCSLFGGTKHPQWKLVNGLVRQQVYQGKHIVWTDIADILYENATGMIDENVHNIPTAVPILKQAACYGNADAMYTLAVILNNGFMVKSDEIQAHAYLMLAVLDKHRLSALALGHRHRHGVDGVPPDMEQSYMYYKYVADSTRQDKESHKDTDVMTESVKLTDEVMLKEQTDEDGDVFNWLKHQAKQGVLSAQTHIARTLYWGSQGLKRNLGQAIEYFRMGAEAEDPQAMYDYGIVLIRGQGTEKNVDEGLKQLKKSADQNNPSALNALGWYALNFDRNATLAVQYFEKAYRMGNPDAMYNLGILYLNGQYPNKSADADKAQWYFSQGAVTGQIDAGVSFAHLSMKGTNKTPRNVYAAAEWSRFIAEKNPAIGYILRKALKAYRDGDIPKSLFYYMMAADAGVQVGSFNLAWLCEENQDGIVHSVEKDCQWRHYNLSIQREPQFVDAYALIKMGDYYWYGCVAEQDVEKAAHYYAEAAKKHDPHAIFNLGFMLEEGAKIKHSVWRSIHVPTAAQESNVTLLEHLYNRCKDSHRTEAYLPCSLALWRIQFLHFWSQYRFWIELTSFVGVAAITTASVFSIYNHLRGGGSYRGGPVTVYT